MRPQFVSTQTSPKERLRWNIDVGLQYLEASLGGQGHVFWRLAADLLEKLMTGVEFPNFLTLVAYNYLD